MWYSATHYVKRSSHISWLLIGCILSHVGALWGNVGDIKWWHVDISWLWLNFVLCIMWIRNISTFSSKHGSHNPDGHLLVYSWCNLSYVIATLTCIFKITFHTCEDNSVYYLYCLLLCYVMVVEPHLKISHRYNAHIYIWWKKHSFSVSSTCWFW